MTKYEKLKMFVIDFIELNGIITKFQVQNSATKICGVLPSTADRYCRWYMERDKIITHPIQDGKINEHAYILSKKSFAEKEEYPSIPSHAEELQEEINRERIDRKIGLNKQLTFEEIKK